LLGRFEALSLPLDLETATTFWNGLGYAARDTAVPWAGIEIDGLPVAYHAPSACPEPLLVFNRDSQGLELQPLLACGLERARNLPSLSGADHQMLRSPGEIALLLLA
jgi:hypothetical protein